MKAWADAFRSSPDLTGVVSVYEDLRRKGLEFPMMELNGYTSSQPQQKVPQQQRLYLPLTNNSVLPAASLLFTFLLGSFYAISCQTVPANKPAPTSLPSVILSSKPPLIPQQTSELKIAFEGTSALTHSQVTKHCESELYIRVDMIITPLSLSYSLYLCVCGERQKLGFFFLLCFKLIFLHCVFSILFWFHTPFFYSFMILLPR